MLFIVDTINVERRNFRLQQDNFLGLSSTSVNNFNTEKKTLNTYYQISKSDKDFLRRNFNFRNLVLKRCRRKLEVLLRITNEFVDLETKIVNYVDEHILDSFSDCKARSKSPKLSDQKKFKHLTKNLCQIWLDPLPRLVRYF